jgi:hypothetical protein
MNKFILLLIFPVYIFCNSVQTTIPKNFYFHKDNLEIAVKEIMDSEVSEEFTYLNFITYFSALIEHESCLSLTHSRCWSSRSELFTRWDNGLPREQGVGLGQLTRAWKSNGVIRLDVVTDLKKRYPRELKDLNWDNIKTRPDLQLKAMLLLWKNNYRNLSNSIPVFERVLFSDSAYNGGYGYILKDRRSCGLRAGCDPNIWFGNVELENNRGNKFLYGTRTANMINRHHVYDVIVNRMGKYYNVFE